MVQLENFLIRLYYIRNFFQITGHQFSDSADIFFLNQTTLDLKKKMVFLNLDIPVLIKQLK